MLHVRQLHGHAALAKILKACYNMWESGMTGKRVDVREYTLADYPVVLPCCCVGSGRKSLSNSHESVLANQNKVPESRRVCLYLRERARERESLAGNAEITTPLTEGRGLRIRSHLLIL